MRILERPTGQLILLTRPNWVLVALAVVMLVMGAVVATWPAKLTALECSRVGPGEGACRIVETHLLSRQTIVRFPMRMLLGAEAVPFRIGRSEKTRFHRLMLALDDDDPPYYFAWYGDAQAARDAAARVTEYAANEHDVFLTIRNDKRPFFFAVAGALAALGTTFLLWGAQRLTVTFDRARDRVTIRRQSWRGDRRTTHPLAAVAGFEVADWRRDCALSMRLASGEAVALSASHDAASFGGPGRVRARRLATAARLGDFCARPWPDQA